MSVARPRADRQLREIGDVSDYALRRNSFACPAFPQHLIKERDMDNATKHEIWVLTLSTLATVPVMAGLGFALVSGIVGF
jgi:hypothetical protein